MKSNQKLSLLFWLRKGKATKDGSAPLYVRVTIDSKDEDISLGRKIHPDFWDVENKKDARPGVEAKKTNSEIVKARAFLEDNFSVLRTQFEVITPIMLKNVYMGKPALVKKGDILRGKTEDQTLIPEFDQFIKIFDKKVNMGLRDDGTLRHWKTTRGKVKSFVRCQYGADDIKLAEIDYCFTESFYNYLTLHQDQLLSEATAKTHIKKTRQILSGCVKRKVISGNPLDDFGCGSPVKDVVPHELYELEIIYQKQLPIARLDEVRDAYIFQCFTGFAYQDTYDLSPENIVKVGSKGEKWLIKDRNKTGVSEMVPILPIVAELIEKYKNHPCRKNKNRLLPINSNYRYNAYLKELADICGMASMSDSNMEFYTHRARHTFAHIMLNSGVPLEDVSRMMGHKNIRTTQRYCKVNKPRISTHMNLVKNTLFTKGGKLKKVS